MSRDHRPRGTLLVQFLLRPLAATHFLPVLVPFPECDRESKSGGQPEFERRERKGGGEIEGNRQNRYTDNVGARRVEIANQDIAYDAAQQPLDGDQVHPVQVSGEQGHERRDKDQEPNGAHTFGQWILHLARAEPANAQHSYQARQQEGADSQKLQQDIRCDCADDPNPVARGARVGQHRGAVQRRVEWRIGNHGEEQEERKDTNHEPDQLIQPSVAGGEKNPGEQAHVGVNPAPGAGGTFRGAATRPEPNNYAKKKVGLQSGFRRRYRVGSEETGGTRRRPL